MRKKLNFSKNFLFENNFFSEKDDFFLEKYDVYRIISVLSHQKCLEKRMLFIISAWPHHRTPKSKVNIPVFRNAILIKFYKTFRVASVKLSLSKTRKMDFFLCCKQYRRSTLRDVNNNSSECECVWCYLPQADGEFMYVCTWIVSGTKWKRDNALECATKQMFTNFRLVYFVNGGYFGRILSLPFFSLYILWKEIIFHFLHFV